MILWIDGPYGVGKSTLAEALHGLRPESFVFDAEEVGNAVRDNLPMNTYSDVFEGYPLWFEFCSELLLEISKSFWGDIFVPMTLIYPDSFEKIAAPLREYGTDIRHILLESDYETVRGRILERGEDEDCWCIENIGLCLKNQAKFDDVIRIKSVDAPVYELAKEVIRLVFGKK